MERSTVLVRRLRRPWEGDGTPERPSEVSESSSESVKRPEPGDEEVEEFSSGTSRSASATSGDGAPNVFPLDTKDYVKLMVEEMAPRKRGKTGLSR
jgi:hypothetical protein